jgi:signal transduction histidine kinase
MTTEAHMRRPIRHRLIIVTVLGVFSSGLSGVALYRAISVSKASRIERAREGVREELAQLASGNPAELEAPSVIGMRGGVARSPVEIAARVPAAWRPLLAEVAPRALRAGATVVLETPLPGGGSAGVLIAGAAPVPSVDGTAWAAVTVRPSPNLPSWRLLLVALAVVTLLLVGSAASALITVKRGATALVGALGELARDLSAPMPRQSVRELDDIADGIAMLAGHLAESRQIQERLGRDLARGERLAALGRVVAGVAHEVRNPLASIKLRLDLAMSSNPSLPPAVIQAISHASSEITRLDRLVADLLIISGRALGARRALDVAALLRARIEALAPWSAQRGVVLRASNGEEALASADADALARALDNLLRNAVEASPPGEVVEASVAADESIVRVRVDDRGAGVPPERVSELFEPFFTTKGDGTGLGLAISRAIARAHGGELTYVRDDGVTRFELVLPETAPRARAGTQPS